MIDKRYVVLTAHFMVAIALSSSILTSGSVGDDQQSSTIYGDPQKIRVRVLGTINQPGLDYAPTVSADGKTLFFVSNRNGSMSLGVKGEPSHDFWHVTKVAGSDTLFTAPAPLSDLNTPNNEGVASIAADRQKFYYAVCDSKGGYGDCDLWEAQQAGNRFFRPRMLGDNVNSKYWESQPYIAPDGSRLYFSSNRPRYEGENHDPDDYDIWYCDWDAARKEWKPARNLGATINTPGQEVAPYIAPDGKTLFYSSNGRKPSIGGLDFYHSTRTDAGGNAGNEQWSTPELAPEPINSREDDQFLSMPVTGDVIYFSSRRSYGTKNSRDFDIYAADVPKTLGAVNLVVKVREACTDAPVASKVTITNQLTKRSAEAQVDKNRDEINIVLSDKDFVSKGKMVDTLPLLIEATSGASGKQRRELRLPKATLFSTQDVTETISIDQRKRLFADMQSRDGRNGLSFKYKEEVVHQRLLPLVFFDRNATEIPKRYRRIRADQRQDFRESFPPRSSLTDYYHILNVYGSRLQNLPSLRLTITGYRDEGTECDESISTRRAEAVKSYLQDVWEVDPERISVVGMGLPRIRSNANDSLGAEENRRCELSVDGPDEEEIQFEKPVSSSWSDAAATIPSIRFLTGVAEPDDESERLIEIRVGDRLVRRLEVDPSAKYVTWDVSQDANVIKNNPASLLRVSMIRVRTEGSECPCDTMSIPVDASEIVSGTDKNGEPAVYRIHSFEAGTFEVDPFNQRYLATHIVPKIRSQKGLKITGHTDVIGMYDHNQMISERQAQSVAELLKTEGLKLAEDDVQGLGEDRPRYSNRFPEGRFYNRAVEIHTK